MVAARTAYTGDPGVDALLALPQVAIIDLRPTGPISAPGANTVAVVGEFERGPLESPTRILDSSDLELRFGGLGFTLPDGTQAAGPVAQRSAGQGEAWNGNGFVWLSQKRFSPFVVIRVDNSAGEVGFWRLACLEGGPGPYSAAANDQATWTLDGGPTATATLLGTAATITGSGGVYPLVAPGTLILSYDDVEDFVVQLAAGDDLAAVIAKVNGRAAATIASANGGELELTSVREGSAARMEVVGGTSLAALGLPAAPVADTWTVTVTGDNAGNYQLRVSLVVSGVPTDFDTTVYVGPAGSTTLLRDQLLSDLQALNVPGFSFSAGVGDTIAAVGDPNVILTGFVVLQEAVGGDVTIANLPVGVATETFGTGNVGDVSNFSVAEAVAIVDAVANLSAEVAPSGNLRVCNDLTPATGTIQGTSGDLLTALGFDTTSLVAANSSPDVVIPAGTRVQDSTATGTVWVTLTDLDTTPEQGALQTGGPYTVKVRPFIDDDTAVASAANDVTIVVDTLPGAFSVDNPASITRLTQPQMDNRYIDALNSTLANAQPANEINYICSARTTPTIRLALRSNALDATREGLAARKAITRPRLGVSELQAIADVGQIRSERVQFAFPGVQTRVAAIAEVGSAGGIGFTDDGIIDVGSDAFLASARSILAPELDAGQDLTETNVGPLAILALERAYDPQTQGSTTLRNANYVRFKAEGIVAPSLDRTAGSFFMTDVTSVLEADLPLLAPANRRAMADFIGDSLHVIGLRFSKKILRVSVRRQLTQELTGFLDGMVSRNQPDVARIDAYELNLRSSRAPGLVEYDVKVRLLETLITLAFHLTTGVTVEVTETAA